MPREIRPRDSQRSKVYAAERDNVPFGELFTSIEEVERFLTTVFQSAWFQKHFPEPSGFQVQNGQGARDAKGWCRQGVCHMKLPQWARTELVILHELGHGLSQARYGSRNIAGHGHEYCAIYLELVTHFMGAEIGLKLKEAFRKHKVKFRPKKERQPMTEEQRAAACARLQRVRPVRAVPTITKKELAAQHRKKVWEAAQHMLEQQKGSTNNPKRFVVVHLSSVRYRGRPCYRVWYDEEQFAEESVKYWGGCRNWISDVIVFELTIKAMEGVLTETE